MSRARAAALLCALLLSPAGPTHARPGGGSSFRSSSSSRSSSRSSSSSSSRSSSSHSGSRSTYSSDDSFDPETFDWIVHFLLGAALAAPALLAMPLLLDRSRAPRRRRKQRREPTPPSLGRFLFGLGLLAASTFLVAGQLRAHAVAPAVIAIVIAVLGWGARLLGDLGGDAVASPPPAAPPRRRDVDGAIDRLRQRDPGFSRVSFLDYAHALYHAVHGWLRTSREAQLRPIVAEDVLRALEAEVPPRARLDAIVVGAMTLDGVETGDDGDAVTLDLEANYSQAPPGEAPARVVVHERWRLERAAGAQTPAPAQMRVLSCRACGAALSVNELAACTYCGASLADGKGYWRLTRRTLVSRERFSTEGLGETVPEEGTSLPTVIDPRLAEGSAAIAAAHGLPDGASFAEALRREVVEPVFQQMYAAWSARTWGAVRHLLTDRLWESQRVWVDAYAAQGLVNKLDDLTVSKVELVRAERDRDYEAATVRVFASGRDYTVDKDGRAVGGDAKRPRRFSEYWIFIRGVGAKAPAAARAEPRCPNCGAPVDRMGETGVCGYCDAKVTTGDFGWVLSAIVQDEVYRG